MLSLVSQTSVLACSLQLARALAPFAVPLLTRRGYTAQAEAAVQGLRQLEASSFPRFDPDSQPHPPHPEAVLASHHPSQRFCSVLGFVRSQYPDTVWSKVASLYPTRHQRSPLAIDIAVGSEGRAGVELAKRGFRVLSINGDDEVLNRTSIYAHASDARINLVTASIERQLVYDGAADLVTCFHGLHLLDVHEALAEMHRITKPGGRLVVAWNDRDLRNNFITQLEALIERHVPSYTRTCGQHELDHWATTLQQQGLFRLREHNTYHNPVVLRNLTTLGDILNSQSYIREALQGHARRAFNSEVRALVEQRFGEGPLLLPMLTRLFVLEKVTPSLQ